MQIRMLKTMAGPEGVRQEGQFYDVEDAVGRGLIEGGVAVDGSSLAAVQAASGDAEDGDLQGEVIALRQEVETLREAAKKPANAKLKEAQERIAALEAEVERLKAGPVEDATDTSVAAAEHATEPRQG